MAYDYDPTPQPEMDKKTAEEILGFESSWQYTQADMTEKYHNMVSEKVSSGATPEEMGRVDHAKAFLDSYFVEDPTATLTSEDDLGIEGGGYRRYEPPSYLETAIGRMITTGADDADEFAPAPLRSVYESAHSSAACKLGYRSDTVYDVPKLDGNYPLWYQATTKLITRFPWRLAFVALIAWGLAGIWGEPVDGSMSDILGDGLGRFFTSVVLVVLALVNTITGFFTNLLRKGLSCIFDGMLRGQITSICKRALSEQAAAAGISRSTSEGAPTPNSDTVTITTTTQGL